MTKKTTADMKSTDAHIDRAFELLASVSGQDEPKPANPRGTDAVNAARNAQTRIQRIAKGFADAIASARPENIAKFTQTCVSDLGFRPTELKPPSKFPSWSAFCLAKTGLPSLVALVCEHPHELANAPLPKDLVNDRHWFFDVPVETSSQYLVEFLGTTPWELLSCNLPNGFWSSHGRAALRLFSARDQASFHEAVVHCLSSKPDSVAAANLRSILSDKETPASLLTDVMAAASAMPSSQKNLAFASHGAWLSICASSSPKMLPLFVDSFGLSSVCLSDKFPDPLSLRGYDIKIKKNSDPDSKPEGDVEDLIRSAQLCAGRAFLDACVSDDAAMVESVACAFGSESFEFDVPLSFKFLPNPEWHVWMTDEINRLANKPIDHSARLAKVKNRWLSLGADPSAFDSIVAKALSSPPVVEPPKTTSSAGFIRLDIASLAIISGAGPAVCDAISKSGSDFEAAAKTVNAVSKLQNISESRSRQWFAVLKKPWFASLVEKSSIDRFVSSASSKQTRPNTPSKPKSV